MARGMTLRKLALNRDVGESQAMHGRHSADAGAGFNRSDNTMDSLRSQRSQALGVGLL